MKKLGVFVGRMNPIHNGHVAVIREMVNRHGVENSLVIVGSSNAPFSLRHFFTYHERKELIKKIFPEMRLVGLPDYHNDKEWLAALDDVLRVADPSLSEVTFFGGCEEDVRFFLEAGRDCTILNRFDGTTPKVSATEVRDCLIAGRSLDGLVDEAIQTELEKLFAEKWEKFKKL